MDESANWKPLSGAVLLSDRKCFHPNRDKAHKDVEKNVTKRENHETVDPSATCTLPGILPESQSERSASHERLRK